MKALSVQAGVRHVFRALCRSGSQFAGCSSSDGNVSLPAALPVVTAADVPVAMPIRARDRSAAASGRTQPTDISGAANDRKPCSGRHLTAPLPAQHSAVQPGPLRQRRITRAVARCGPATPGKTSRTDPIARNPRTPPLCNLPLKGSRIASFTRLRPGPFKLQGTVHE